MPPCPPSSTRPEQRFTLNGGDELEQHLERVCARVLHGVRGLIPGGALEALYLGGGYGRGEGGVLATPEGEQPYSDFEFYLFLGGNRHLKEWRHRRALEVFGEILTPSAGAHVEFKIASRSELERRPISMYSYDLVAAHRLVFGPADYLAHCAHHCHAPKIPLSEATRLLMNRCTGLLLARARLEAEHFTTSDADFVHRNIAKAALALGDAVLTVYHRYNWSARERHRRLLHDLAHAGAPAWHSDVIRWHAEGVEFKLHPVRSKASREELLERWRSLLPLAHDVFLWVEEQRLGRLFSNAVTYALDPRPKFPGHANIRQMLANLRQGGITPLFNGEPLKPARDRLLRALALLLWERDALRQPRLLMRLQRELTTDAVALSGFVRAYCQIWQRAS
jgi:hypothetical protein